MVCLQSPTNLSVIKKVSTLSKCTRVVVLLEGKLCKQRNSSFCLTCDQAFFFGESSFLLASETKWKKDPLIAGYVLS